MRSLIGNVWHRWSLSFTALFLTGFVFAGAGLAGLGQAQTDNQPGSQPYGYNLIPERDAYAAPSQKADQAPALVNFELHTGKIRLLPATQSSGRGASFGDDQPLGGGFGAAPAGEASHLAH